MTEVSFYHMTRSPLDKVLPQLMLKLINSGNRAVLLASDGAMLQEADALLWRFSTNKVVPHGTKEDGFTEEQPVYLTLQEENPNNANMLVVIGGAEPEYIDKFDRCLDIFDGNNEAETAQARSRWQKYKEQDMELTYWQQNPKGAWEKAA